MESEISFLIVTIHFSLLIFSPFLSVKPFFESIMLTSEKCFSEIFLKKQDLEMLVIFYFLETTNS